MQDVKKGFERLLFSYYELEAAQFYFEQVQHEFITQFGEKWVLKILELCADEGSLESLVHQYLQEKS